jgi:hypothetical protein
MLDTVDAALARVVVGPEEPELGPPAETALELMQAVYRDRRQPMARRMRGRCGCVEL